jgi:hypothetical protein
MESRIRRQTPVSRRFAAERPLRQRLGQYRRRSAKSFGGDGFARVPIPKFASFSGTLVLRTSESKDTSNLSKRVWLWFRSPHFGLAGLGIDDGATIDRADDAPDGAHLTSSTSGFPFSTTYVPSSAALPLPTFFAAWIRSGRDEQDLAGLERYRRLALDLFRRTRTLALSHRELSQSIRAGPKIRQGPVS